MSCHRETSTQVPVFRTISSINHAYSDSLLAQDTLLRNTHHYNTLFTTLATFSQRQRNRQSV